MSREQIATRNLILICNVIFLIQHQVHVVAADNSESSTSSWSFKFNGLDIFNIPNIGNAFFRGTTEGPSREHRRRPPITLNKESVDPDIIEDSILKTPELITKYGYPCEIHHVTTDDDYILEMHRIPKKGGIPVLLFHGLLDSSATWVMMGVQNGLAYLLYDRGYDVWMPIARGNTYSRNHTKYNTKHATFWDFSFHEIGKYDLPANIDYVLQETGYEKIHYIGHSQGTVTFWVMCSERPEYSDKILLMQALAPVAFIEHCKSPVVRFLAYFSDPLGSLLNLIGAHEFLPNDDFMTMIGQLICDDDRITEEICTNIIFLVTGFDKSESNETMLPVVLGHAPAGAATKQMQHYGQLKRSGYFRQYDYGWLRNHWRYNSIHPPSYNLNNVRNKVVLHYSQNDWLAAANDVEHLNELLPNVVGRYLVHLKDFNHLDFVWGIDVRELLYNRVFHLMQLVEKGDL